MTRQLKPQIVDEVASPGGHVRIPVYFDRNNLDFYVEPPGGGDKLRAGTAREVKQLAKDMLTKVVPFTWEGIIIVKTKSTWADGNHHERYVSTMGTRVEFEYTRWDRSPHPTNKGHFVHRLHTKDFDDTNDYNRKRRERNEDLKNVWTGEDDVVLPYDDATWDGLCALKRAVDAAQVQLYALMKRKDLAARLRLLGTQPAMPILPEAARVPFAGLTEVTDSGGHFGKKGGRRG